MPMSDDLYIYGAGGHAKVVAATARLCGYNIKGFCEDSDARVGEEFFGSHIVSFADVPEGSRIFVAFGNNSVRLTKGSALSRRFSIPTIIHPSAQIAEGVEIGLGCYIGAFANIDPGCRIGNFCIVNNNANVSHDTILEPGCHVCGGVNIAGCCRIGECAMLGIGSCMIEKCSVGKNSIIGAGSAVIRNIAADSTAVGSPAKVISQNNKTCL